MPHFNRSFELTIADIDLIESSLRETGRALADARIDAAASDPAGLPDLDARIRRVNKLLGRLHNQKTFFRPTAGTYVGG